MKIIAFLLLCFTTHNCFAQSDKLQLQSCLNVEYAKIFAEVPKGLSEAEAFKTAYSKSYDFASIYEKKLKLLPNPESTIPEMLKIAGEAGKRMASNLSKVQIDRTFNACRASFSKENMPSISLSETFKNTTDTKSSSNIVNVDEVAVARLKPLAALLNNVLKEDGIVGVTSLVDACYYAPKARGYDCLVLDMGAMFLDASMARGFNLKNTIEYFSDDAHVKRVNDAISKGDYSLQDALKVQTAINPLIAQAMVDSLKNLASDSDEKCIVIDPDIATTFVGECIDKYAEGYGLARGRDEFKGDFKRGEAHGQGQYTHGKSSRWTTQVFRGNYFRGTKNGFGVLSIAADSNHPALESMKKYGYLSEGRYFQSALYAAGKALIGCKSEAECLSRLPKIDFSEISAHITYGGEYIDIDELSKLTQRGVSSLGYSQNFNSCMTDEIMYEYFGGNTKKSNFQKLEVKDFYRYLVDKKSVSQPYLYCLKNK